MAEQAENLTVLTEYEELLSCCPVLAVDPEIAQTLDRRTLQILSSTARNNCQQMRERQRQGIARAQAQGVRFGRPRVEVPANFQRLVIAWERKEIALTQVLQQTGLSRATFYRYLKRYREKS